MLTALRHCAVSCWEHTAQSSFIFTILTCTTSQQPQLWNTMFQIKGVVSYLDVLSFDTDPHWISSRLLRCVRDSVGSVAVVDHCRLHGAEGTETNHLVNTVILLSECNWYSILINRNAFKTTDFLHFVSSQHTSLTQTLARSLPKQTTYG